MGKSTAENEGGEQYRQPGIIEVTTPIEEDEDRRWNREVSQGRRGIGKRVQRDQVRAPQQAVPVRHECCRAEEPYQRISHAMPRCWGKSQGCNLSSLWGLGQSPILASKHRQSI